MFKKLSLSAFVLASCTFMFNAPCYAQKHDSSTATLEKKEASNLNVSPIEVKDAWVRATVKPQKVTGAFFQITSKTDAKLVGVKSDVTKEIEIHTMEMVGNVMKMRQIESLDLPANKTVELKPGSYHVMLFNLAKEIKAGDSIKLTLIVEGQDKVKKEIEVSAIAKK